MKNSLANILLVVMVVLGVCLGAETDGNLLSDDTSNHDHELRVLRPSKGGSNGKGGSGGKGGTTGKGGAGGKGGTRGKGRAGGKGGSTGKGGTGSSDSASGKGGVNGKGGNVCTCKDGSSYISVIVSHDEYFFFSAIETGLLGEGW